jgi:hypothetical protein
MSKATSGDDRRGWALLGQVWGAASFCVLTVLPLCGLILFFEMTRPAQVSGPGFFATQMTDRSLDRSERHKGSLSGGIRVAARFEGVSAEIRRDDVAAPAPRMFTSNDAKQAFGDEAFVSLRIGFQTEFVTKDRHRFALRVVSREPIIDQPVPDNKSLVTIAPASTARVVAFIWGQWLYSAEIEDKGVELEIVVQKVL